MADPQARIDAMIKALKEHHHKLTPQRLAIVKILAHSDGHPSVEHMYRRLQTDYPTMSLATVYRNVMLIKSLGQVLELGFSDDSNRYDGNKPYPHPHLICVSCKKIMDPDLDTLKDMAHEIAAETGFEILTHRLDFFGTCPDCRNTF